MIGIIFTFCSEIVEVRIDKNQLLFRTSKFGGAFVPIEGLRLDKGGALKEFPDLQGDDAWREKVIKRFKEKLKKMKNEEEEMKYIIKDLSKFGYVPYAIQRKGHRTERFK